MQIEILSADVEENRTVWDGKERVSYAQWALLKQGGFMLSFVCRHNAPEDAYKPGLYELDPASFSSNNGRLGVDRVKLRPLASKPVSPAASVKG